MLFIVLSKEDLKYTNLKDVVEPTVVWSWKKYSLALLHAYTTNNNINKNIYKK